LRLHPDQPFYRFEAYQGKPALRYATAVRIEPSCVTVHNVKASRAPDVWREGDVSGVYEVILPVDDAVAKMALEE
jgi:adenylate cyclase